MANLQNYKQVKIRMDDMISHNFLGSKILVTFTLSVLLEVPFLQYHWINPNRVIFGFCHMTSQLLEPSIMIDSILSICL